MFIQSLKHNHMKRKKRISKDDTARKAPFVYGDPEYSAEDDIYSRETRLPLREEGDGFDDNEKTERKILPGDELDIPGAELDDPEEKTGSEDEENNYYSLGGDNHDDLEEDKS